jgi:hypothetical protein
MTPSDITLLLRQPVEPAHGVWQIYANVQNALATLIEQNERIIELLGPTTEVKK